MPPPPTDANHDQQENGESSPTATTTATTTAQPSSSSSRINNNNNRTQLLALADQLFAAIVAKDTNATNDNSAATLSVEDIYAMMDNPGAAGVATASTWASTSTTSPSYTEWERSVVAERLTELLILEQQQKKHSPTHDSKQEDSTEPKHDNKNSIRDNPNPQQQPHNDDNPKPILQSTDQGHNEKQQPPNGATIDEVNKEPPREREASHDAPQSTTLTTDVHPKEKKNDDDDDTDGFGFGALVVPPSQPAQAQPAQAQVEPPAQAQPAQAQPALEPSQETTKEIANETTTAATRATTAVGTTTPAVATANESSAAVADGPPPKQTSNPDSLQGAMEEVADEERQPQADRMEQEQPQPTATPEECSGVGTATQQQPDNPDKNDDNGGRQEGEKRIQPVKQNTISDTTTTKAATIVGDIPATAATKGVVEAADEILAVAVADARTETTANVPITKETTRTAAACCQEEKNAAKMTMELQPSTTRQESQTATLTVEGGSVKDKSKDKDKLTAGPSSSLVSGQVDDKDNVVEAQQKDPQQPTSAEEQQHATPNDTVAVSQIEIAKKQQEPHPPPVEEKKADKNETGVPTLSSLSNQSGGVSAENSGQPHTPLEPPTTTNKSDEIDKDENKSAGVPSSNGVVEPKWDETAGKGTTAPSKNLIDDQNKNKKDANISKCDETGGNLKTDKDAVTCQDEAKEMDNKSSAASICKDQNKEEGENDNQMRKSNKDAKWLTWWELLRDYRADKGNTFPSLREVYQGKTLGYWVNNQRRLYRQKENGHMEEGSCQMSDWRFGKLNEIGFGLDHSCKRTIANNEEDGHVEERTSVTASVDNRNLVDDPRENEQSASRPQDQYSSNNRKDSTSTSQATSQDGAKRIEPQQPGNDIHTQSSKTGSGNEDVIETEQGQNTKPLGGQGNVAATGFLQPSTTMTMPARDAESVPPTGDQDTKWLVWWDLLRAYREEMGHTSPTQKEEYRGKHLGVWVSNQRAARRLKDQHPNGKKLKHKMSDQRIAKLNELGFVWKKSAHRPADTTNRLLAEASEKKTVNAAAETKPVNSKETKPANPTKRQTAGSNKNQTVNSTKQQPADATESHLVKSNNSQPANSNKEQRAESIRQPDNSAKRQHACFTAASSREGQWQSWWDLLKEYKDEMGHSSPSANEVYKGKKLGTWCCNQRQAHRLRDSGPTERMTDARVAQLNALSFVWNPRHSKPPPMTDKKQPDSNKGGAVSGNDENGKTPAAASDSIVPPDSSDKPDDLQEVQKHEAGACPVEDDKLRWDQQAISAYSQIDEELMADDNLVTEKRQLFQQLNAYEQKFAKEKGRQVSTIADIQPMEEQYNRYQEIEIALEEREKKEQEDAKSFSASKESDTKENENAKASEETERKEKDDVKTLSAADRNWLVWWELLRDFKAEKGHPNPAWREVYKKKCIGPWCYNQRRDFRRREKGDFKSGSCRMSDFRIAKLNELEFQWEVENVKGSKRGDTPSQEDTSTDVSDSEDDESPTTAPTRSSNRSSYADEENQREASVATRTRRRRESASEITDATVYQRIDHRLGPRYCLLTSMLEMHQMQSKSSLSFADILAGLRINNRSAKWRQQWKTLIEEGCIERKKRRRGATTYTNLYQLTDSGVKAAREALKQLGPQNERKKNTTQPAAETARLKRTMHENTKMRAESAVNGESPEEDPDPKELERKADAESAIIAANTGCISKEQTGVVNEEAVRESSSEADAEKVIAYSKDCANKEQSMEAETTVRELSSKADHAEAGTEAVIVRADGCINEEQTKVDAERTAHKASNELDTGTKLRHEKQFGEEQTCIDTDRTLHHELSSKQDSTVVDKKTTVESLQPESDNGTSQNEASRLNSGMKTRGKDPISYNLKMHPETDHASPSAVRGDRPGLSPTNVPTTVEEHTVQGEKKDQPLQPSSDPKEDCDHGVSRMATERSSVILANSKKKMGDTTANVVDESPRVDSRDFETATAASSSKSKKSENAATSATSSLEEDAASVQRLKDLDAQANSIIAQLPETAILSTPKAKELKSKNISGSVLRPAHVVGHEEQCHSENTIHSEKLLNAVSTGISWYYADRRLGVQGPFPRCQMRQWLDDGCLELDLPLSQDAAGPFRPLSAIYPDVSLAFKNNEFHAREEQDKDLTEPTKEHCDASDVEVGSSKCSATKKVERKELVVDKSSKGGSDLTDRSKQVQLTPSLDEQGVELKTISRIVSQEQGGSFNKNRKEQPHPPRKNSTAPMLHQQEQKTNAAFVTPHRDDAKVSQVQRMEQAGEIEAEPPVESPQKDPTNVTPTTTTQRSRKLDQEQDVDTRPPAKRIKLEACSPDESNQQNREQEQFDAKWKTARQGCKKSQYFIGRCYRHGTYGVEQNHKIAFMWFSKAASQGHVKARCNVGICYANGHGVEQNWAKAARWYEVAADNGSTLAASNLGWCCEHGKGVIQDYSAAASYYGIAASKGYGPAKQGYQRVQKHL